MRSLAAGAGLLASTAHADPRALTEDEKLARLASNTYPLRWLFKRRSAAGGMSGGGQAAGQAKSGSESGPGPGRRTRRGDEEEVRRDHDARLPAVHQGPLPRRPTDGPVVVALRRRGRRCDVRREQRHRRGTPAHHPRVRSLECGVGRSGSINLRIGLRRRACGVITSRTTRRATSPISTPKRAPTASRSRRNGSTAARGSAPRRCV